MGLSKEKVSGILNVKISFSFEKFGGNAQTLGSVADDFTKRSDSMSYLRTLKHSSLSSKNSA